MTIALTYFRASNDVLPRVEIPISKTTKLSLENASARKLGDKIKLTLILHQ